MTISIRFVGPFVVGSDNERLALSNLDDDQHSHIHAELQITVGGRMLPRMGFFGPDDVCLGQWVAELSNTTRVLSSDNPACYVFDEGEQGQPAFEFHRIDDQVFISVIDSAISDGKAVPSWQREACGLRDFQHQTDAFFQELKATIAQQTSPQQAVRWFANNGVST